MEFQKTLQEWAILFASRSIQDFLKFARAYHLSMPQINVLMRLYYSGPSTILQLRGDMVGSRAAASQMIDELVKKGWVERVESTADRRVKSVSLTGEGRRLVENAIAARRKWLADLASTFSPEQQEEISKVLTIMIQAVAKLEPSANHPDRAEGEMAELPEDGETLPE